MNPFYFISEALVFAIEKLLNLIPDFNFPVFTVPQIIKDTITLAWFFLPMDTIGQILALSIVFTIIRFAFAVVLRVKSFIPTMGD